MQFLFYVRVCVRRKHGDGQFNKNYLSTRVCGGYLLGTFIESMCPQLAEVKRIKKTLLT